MINSRFLFPAIVFLVIFALSSPSQAFFNRDVKKAKEFMAAGMYPQAIELLSKRINDKPTDAEAHFQLGICFYVDSSCQALFLYFLQSSDFIPCNSIAGMVSVREWVPN